MGRLQNRNIQLLLRFTVRFTDALIIVGNTSRNRALALILAHIAPCILNVWHRARINRFSISNTELIEHFTGQNATVEHFWLRFFHDSLPQTNKLLLELRPELVIVHLLKILQFFFVFYGPDHGEAIAVFEEQLNHTSNSVFLFDSVTTPFLRLKCIF